MSQPITPIQPFVPPWSANKEQSMHLHVLRRWRGQTRTTHAVVWLQVKVRDLGPRLRPWLYVGLVFDDSSADAAYAAIV